MMRLAYNTNGLAEHDLVEAIALLAETGYRGVAITLNHGSLNPFDPQTARQLPEVGEALRRHQFRCVIETGARYLLDPRAKHEPTLVTRDSAARSRRIEFLCRAIDIASALQAECVSLWSGVVRDGATRDESLSRLTGGLARVLDYAAENQVTLAFEPEPGMLIATLSEYGRLLETLSASGVDAARLRLTIDVGHLHCQGETPIADEIRRWGERLANVHVEDMRAGVHEHLMFGEGEIDFRPVVAALGEIGYAGLVSVELSRHSHDGPAAARQAYNYLRPILDSAKRE